MRAKLAGETVAPGPRTLPRETAALGRLDLAVQRRLVALGLYAGAVDGIVGPGTTEAIRAFQRAAGVKVDGRPSPALLDRLDAALSAGARRMADESRP